MGPAQQRLDPDHGAASGGDHGVLDAALSALRHSFGISEVPDLRRLAPNQGPAPAAC